LTATIRCPNSHPVEPDVTYCTICGAAIERDADAPAVGGSDLTSPRGIAAMSATRQPTLDQRGTGWRYVAVATAAALVLAAVAAVVFFGSGASRVSSAHTHSQPMHSASPKLSQASTTLAPVTSTTTATPASTGSGPFPLLTGATIEAGPSMSAAPFGPAPANTAVSGSAVTVNCTAYGDEERAYGVTSNIWDATSIGWIADVFVDSGTPTPQAEACVGTVADPSSSHSPLSSTAGPFPLLGDFGRVTVFSDHSLQAPPRGTFPVGTFVTLACEVETGVTVQAPQQIGGQGSNSQWDQITSPTTGWVPDSWVDSQSNGSVAPPCA